MTKLIVAFRNSTNAPKTQQQKNIPYHLKKGHKTITVPKKPYLSLSKALKRIFLTHDENIQKILGFFNIFGPIFSL